MAYTPQLEDGEKLALQIAFKLSEKSQAFNFAVSDQALYWPAIKAFAMTDATYFERIRHGQISEACVRRLPPYGLWVAAVFMVLVGLETMYVMYAPLVNHEPGVHHVSGWPFALFVGGILMPFATKGRVALEIKTQDKTHRWKPPLVIDKASKQKIQETFDQILVACEKSGLRISRR
jgi:hypothetical protein